MNAAQSEHGAPAPTPARPGRMQRAGLAIGVLWVAAWAVASWALMPMVAADPVVGQQVVPADWVLPAVFLVVSVVGALVLLTDRTHTYGILLMAFAVGSCPATFSGLYALYGTYLNPDASLPLVAAASWYQDLMTMPQLAVVALLLPGLFPDGRAVQGRWGRALRRTSAGWVLLVVLWMMTERSLENWFLGLADIPANPTGILDLPVGPLAGLWGLMMVVSVLVSVASVRSRWRSAGTDIRLQMKWPLLAFLFIGTWVIVDIADTALVELFDVDLGLRPLAQVMSAGTALAFAVALGLGVLRYRLYDVDRVINRTLVYGVLTAGVTAVYALVVVGIGSLLPGVSDRGLALIATVVVAIAFEPARRRLQSIVNRVMFGQRDDPYRVIARLGEVMAGAGTPSENLETVVETVARSLKLPWVAVELFQRDGSVERVEHGTSGAPLEAEATVPLVHADVEVGRLLAASRSVQEPLRRADRRLLEHVAHQAGAVAATARLTVDLQRSRERLVLAREDERRRIRRDLHDGLGPTLAAQTLALDAAADRVANDPAAARELLGGLKRETQVLVADIRRLVHDLRPPALDELGLAGALVAHVGQLDGSGSVAVRIRTDPDPLPDLPAAVEVAAWRIVREAVTNVLRHADARSCTVRVTVGDAGLEAIVMDDGIGLPVVPRHGVGLSSMRERAEELGGTLTVTDGPDGGTEVAARLPFRNWGWRPVAASSHPVEVADG